MLKLAVEAGLPLIAVRTDDTVNVERVLKAVTGVAVRIYSPTLKIKPDANNVYWYIPEENFEYAKMYQKFSDADAILILVNPADDYSGMFPAGVLSPPPSVIKGFVDDHGTPENHDGLMAALAGLSYEQMFQVSKLAMAKHGEYTATSVQDIRRQFFGDVRGLQMLSTELFYYAPTLPLTEWLASRGRFLTEFDVPSLTPRGMLMKGPPGTGKTEGAKFLARELGLPLYILDIAHLMEKYHGESEKNLRRALAQAERSAPCIMLIDEVEKLFSTGSDDSGVTSRVLSSILWWLQEHKSKVFTVMTTNKEEDIPPELYRPGRIDSTIEFKKLQSIAGGTLENEVRVFALPLAAKLSKTVGLKKELNLDSVSFDGDFSHAEVTEILKQEVTSLYLQQEGG